MEKVKLGAKWWLSLILGFVTGFVLCFGGMQIVNMIMIRNMLNDISNTDSKLEMVQEIIADNEVFTLEMVGLEEENVNYSMSLTIKATNKLDVPISLSFKFVEINGYIVNSSYYINLNPNDTGEDLMYISDDLREFDIKKITDIKFMVEVFGVDNYAGKVLGPYTSTSLYKATYNQSDIDEKVNKGKVIYDENGVVITVLDGRYETNSFAPMQWLLIENNNPYSLHPSANNIFINNVGSPNAMFFFQELAPNSKTKAPVILDMSDSEKNKNKKIESVDIDVRFFNIDEKIDFLTNKIKVK